MDSPVYEHFRHGADIGVRGHGATKAEAFAGAAQALTAVITDLAAVRTVEEVAIAVDGADDDLLLVEWLNAVIYEMGTRRLIFAAYEVRCDGGKLRAVARGEPVDVARHHPAVEVKGATLTELAVGRAPDGRWFAQCVVDV